MDLTRLVLAVVARRATTRPPVTIGRTSKRRLTQRIMHLAWKHTLVWSIVGSVALIVGLVVMALRPWMTPGQTVYIGKWQFNGSTFQVWQRKTRYLTEPFATGLFVRAQSGQWLAYCLDHQDIYRSRIGLKQQGQKVTVWKGSRVVGEFDLDTQTFSFLPIRQICQPTPIAGDPPGIWWVGL